MILTCLSTVGQPGRPRQEIPVKRLPVHDARQQFPTNTNPYGFSAHRHGAQRGCLFLDVRLSTASRADRHLDMGRLDGGDRPQKPISVEKIVVNLTNNLQGQRHQERGREIPENQVGSREKGTLEFPVGLVSR